VADIDPDEEIEFRLGPKLRDLGTGASPLDFAYCEFRVNGESRDLDVFGLIALLQDDDVVEERGHQAFCAAVVSTKERACDCGAEWVELRRG